MTVWRRALRLLVMTALALVAYFVVPVGVKDESVGVRLLISLLALVLLTAAVIWQVVLHVEDPSRQVDGLLIALVVAVLAFALAFFRLEVGYPGQIPGIETRVDSLYFTMSTLLTIGYGDIHAVGQTARVVVLIAMVFNVAVIATAVTTLSNRVRMHAEERADARRTARGSGEPAQSRRTQRKPR
ncbi:MULTISPECIES: potassium channel family protein [unclassified Nocardioides]|uniref:potassium channel family protein n=1 Tax=Nocardioides sp. URHA0032 TaxID=1380388 RepID=UPI000AEEC674|nr:potassium channel family protein [Nocardioides sp. URHA0032]